MRTPSYDGQKSACGWHMLRKATESLIVTASIGASHQEKFFWMKQSELSGQINTGNRSTCQFLRTQDFPCSDLAGRTDTN